MLTCSRSPIVTYPPTDNETLNAEAMKWGEKMRAAAFGDIKQRHAYVNYAQGTETVQELYGYVTPLTIHSQIELKNVLDTKSGESTSSKPSKQNTIRITDSDTLVESSETKPQATCNILFNKCPIYGHNESYINNQSSQYLS